MKKKVFLIICIFIKSILMVKAIEAPPPGEPGGGNTQTPTYTGATTIEKNTNKEKGSYSSSKALENAILVKGGTSTLTSPIIKKQGDGSDESADFYGTNAAVLSINESVLTLEKAAISTNGKYANGVFSYGTATINVNNSKIVTSKDNSGGIMVAGGGKLYSNNNTIETKGNSSAAIRSDRGGGTITVEGGSYKTIGSGSPAIYSTAFVSVENATLESTTSEGIVVEGANSVEISNTTITDSNTKLHGNSETYKNIFLYQSMSGDAEEGLSSFQAENSTITTNKGDTIFVTNTTSKITLTDTEIINNDNGALLRVQVGKWGKSGSNGGNVELTLESEKIQGDVIVDKISSLKMFISTNSVYQGAINKDNKGKVELQISSESDFVLQGDSYVTKLTNADPENNNIYANGHKLYVNGKEVTINGSKYGSKVKPVKEEKKDYTLYYYIGGGIMAFLLLIIVIIIISRKRKEAKKKQEEEVVQLPMMDATPKSVDEVYKNIRK